MKAAFVRFASLALVLVTGGLVAMTYSPTSRKVAGASTQQPGLPLSVMFDPSNLDANTQHLYQSMQDAINGFTITPNDRTAYYSAVNNVNGYTVGGWRGIITNVQQNANGHLVSIDVLPGLSADWAPCAIITDSDYSELYQVFADGTFQYVGALDPQGLAGQMPAITGL